MLCTLGNVHNIRIQEPTLAKMLAIHFKSSHSPADLRIRTLPDLRRAPTTRRAQCLPPSPSPPSSRHHLHPIPPVPPVPLLRPAPLAHPRPPPRRCPPARDSRAAPAFASPSPRSPPLNSRRPQVRALQLRHLPPPPSSTASSARTAFPRCATSRASPLLPSSTAASLSSSAILRRGWYRA